MINLYESILGDIDANIEMSDNNIAAINANKPDSTLRELFGVGNTYINDNPFSIENHNTLNVDYSATGGIWLWHKEGSDPTTVKSEIGKSINNINVILKTGSFVISDSIEDLNKTFATNVNFNGRNCTLHILRDGKYDTINDINFNMIDNSGGIYVYSRVPAIVKNVSFINKSGDLYFTRVPHFNNVTFSGYRLAILVPNTRWSNGIERDIYSAPQFENIFEFGYNISVNGKSVNIKNLNDIEKLLKGKAKTFDQWPYRVKPTAKMTDFIDISKCHNLKFIDISDEKMGMVFINLKNKPSHMPDISAYYSDMLKPSEKITDNEIPQTADGWLAIIYKV